MLGGADAVIPSKLTVSTKKTKAFSPKPVNFIG